MLQFDDVLKDIRDDDTRMKIVDRESWENNPKSRCEVYWNRKNYTKIHAERWPLAISAYKKYGCFDFSENECPGKFYFDANDNAQIKYVKKDGTDVVVAADILTEVEAIMVLEDKFKNKFGDDDEIILKAFYRVSYTIGNFCMIWKNPSGNPKGIDHVWRKLKKGLLNDKDELNEPGTNLEKRIVLNSRTEDDLFAIFNESKSAKEIIDMLYFQDYFDDEWNIKTNYYNLIKEIEDKEQFINVVKELTILIIQRGYRIVKNYHDNVFGKEQEQELNGLFEEVGLNF